MTCVYYAYWSGIQSRRASFHPRLGRLALVWPTNADLTCVYVAWRHAEFPRFRAMSKKNFLATLMLVPGLQERVAAGRRGTRFVGTTDLPSLYRASRGPRWALVGDARHHQDPTHRHGHDGRVRLLADALDDALTGRRAPDTALAFG